MKKLLFLLCAITFMVTGSIQAQTPLQVSGYVTDELTGDPVTGHDVYIMVNDSTIFYSTAITDQNGFYMDTIIPGGFVINSVYLLTNDLCTYGVHDTLIQNPGSVVTADFEICVDTIPNTSCQASFYYLPDSSNYYTIQFFDNSTSSLPVESWDWDFGDGTGSGLQNPTHAYNSSGYYNVCLTITSDSGQCISTACMLVYISGGGASCDAEFYYVEDSSYTVYFYDLSTPANTITSYYWDFGDGNSSYLQNPVHSYAVPGTYLACLTIESIDSGIYCVDTSCMPVIILGGGGNICEADFYYVYDSLGAGNNVLNFYDLSTPVGLIDTWYWDFGDGSFSTEQNPVHTYSSAGIYGVCLSITADSGFCTSVHCDTVFVYINEQLQLGGNVFAGIYQLDNGFSYGYKSENGVITEVYSGMIDTLGYYQFYPLAAADYYVKIEPSPNSTYFGQYVPTYYGDVTTWDDAVLINLSQNIYTADVNLVPVNMGMFGPGTMSGTIEHGSTNKAYTPASDIQIMLINEEGEYVGLVYSDDDGAFEFNGLNYGIYSIHAEVMGVHMEPNEYTITEDAPAIQDISMILTDDEIFFGPNDIETLGDVTLSEVYPNPVRDQLKIDIGSTGPTMITVKILNQLGQEMHTESLHLDSRRLLQINTDQLQPGMYFLEVISKDGYRSTRRFVKL